MSNKAIQSTAAPAAIGPFTPAIQAENTIYVSGQLPIDPNSEEFPGDDITSQTRQSLSNIRAILKEVGMSMADVTKTTVYLADIAEFGAMNEVYAEFFSEPYPARAAFGVAALPKAARVEIECIAVKSR